MKRVLKYTAIVLGYMLLHLVLLPLIIASVTVSMIIAVLSAIPFNG
jgi:hypothetical protein